MTQNIDDILEEIITTSALTSPNDIAVRAIGKLSSDDYLTVLQNTLGRYVSYYMADRRRSNILEEPAVVEENFAPDDLLAEDVQEIVETQQKKMLKARGSARVNAIRTEWQRHFDDSIWNGTSHIKFGDATAVDLKGAAKALRTQADAFNGKAERYNKIATVLGDSKRVRDLTDDPTK